MVAHDELLASCRALAADIVSNDQAGVRQILGTYRKVVATTVSEGWELSLIHISEHTRLLSISYAVFCLKKKTNHTSNNGVP